jgi:hypothetical protein
MINIRDQDIEIVWVFADAMDVDVLPTRLGFFIMLADKKSPGIDFR